MRFRISVTKSHSGIPVHCIASFAVHLCNILLQSRAANNRVAIPRITLVGLIPTEWIFYRPLRTLDTPSNHRICHASDTAMELRQRNGPRRANRTHAFRQAKGRGREGHGASVSTKRTLENYGTI